MTMAMMQPMPEKDRMNRIQLEARQAAYLRAVLAMALDLRIFRETIDDEALEVIGEAMGSIGRQLARMRYPDGLLPQDLFPLIFQLRADILPFRPEEELRETFTMLH